MALRRCVALVCGALALAGTAAADVHLVRKSNGSAVIFNDVGSGWRVNGKAPTDAYLLGRKEVPTPFDETIREHATRVGVDPTLVKCVMLVESNYNPRAVSRKGARGLMQLMPDTARRYGVRNVFEPAENIRGGVRYLSDLLGLYRGNVTLALAAYNAGESAVAKYSGVPPYPETLEYVRRALVAYKGSPMTALLGGGFKGLEIAPAAKLTSVSSAPPVRIQTENDTVLLSNMAVVRREAPVLGRVER